MKRTPTVFRRAARVLVIDQLDRVLLLRGFDPARPGEFYWFTVGGGINPDESPAEAASRELYEEIGLALPPDELGNPMAHGVVEFDFDGTHYHQEQVFYSLQTDSIEIILDRREEYELATITEHRWWSIAELAATSEVFYPADLLELLSALHR